MSDRKYSTITFSVHVEGEMDEAMICHLQDEVEQTVIDMIESGEHPQLEAVSVRVQDGSPIVKQRNTKATSPVVPEK